jgi:uncharacterized protein YndB with AHSA1/START domain
MKILLRILAGLGLLLLLALIVALFTKKDYAVEREVTINKPRQEVYDYLKYLKNQDNFSKWAMMDPNAKKEYKGTDGTLGFSSSWESDNKNVGKGEQEISKLTEGERIEYNLHFIKPMDARANAAFALSTPAENETKVTWSFSSRMNYPMNLVLLCVDMDKMLGKDLDLGLANLKNLLEKK